MFYIRTIKNGKVKINNVIYKIDERHRKYDNRLENMKYVFGTCPREQNFIYCWGTEEMYKEINNEEKLRELCEREPSRIDNSLPWLWWYK